MIVAKAVLCCCCLGEMEGSMITQNKGAWILVQGGKEQEQVQSKRVSKILWRTASVFRRGRRAAAGTSWCDSTFLVMQLHANHVAFLSHSSYCQLYRKS